MKAVFKFSSWMAILMIALMACSKNDDPSIDPENPGDSGYFGVKKATIVYELLGGPWTETISFDNNGKQIRIEYNYATDYINNEAWIMDETAKKAYHLDVTAKTYEESTLKEIQDLREGFIFDESDFNTGFTKSTETIAGKSCTAYSGAYSLNGVSGTVLASGWSGILFHSKLDEDDVLLATSFSETLPANSFTVPSDYKKSN